MAAGRPLAATNRLPDTISSQPLVTDFRGVVALTGGTQFVTLTKLSPDNLIELSAVSSLDCSQEWFLGPFLVLVWTGQRDWLNPKNGGSPTAGMEFGLREPSTE